MRRLVALIVVLVLTFALVTPPAAEAHRRFGPGVAVGFAAFGLFSLLAAPFYLLPRPAYAYPPAYPYGYAPPYASSYVDQGPVVERQVYMSAPPAASAPYGYGYGSPPVVSAPPAPASQPTVVEYPHGRYELRGDGMRTAYVWVWVPAVPPPPPPPPAPPATQ